MRRLASTLTLFMLGLLIITAQQKEINVKSSNIEWLGKKVTGEHTGNILFKSGTLILKNGELSGGEFLVDMSSITCTDIENADYNAKLVGHLKSDDFFGVDKHPTSKLKLKDVKKMDDVYQVEGELTIKGKTHPISFNVKNSGNTYEGMITIDRTDYDVRYGSGKFFDGLGDKMIYDDFTLTFKVLAQ